MACQADISLTDLAIADPFIRHSLSVQSHTRTGYDESTMLPLLIQSAVVSQTQKNFARWTSAVPLRALAHCFAALAM